MACPTTTGGLTFSGFTPGGKLKVWPSPSLLARLAHSSPFFCLSSMSVERDIRFDLIARLCPNASGAELRSVCTEAGMFAIRARRKVASEKDFLASVEKVIRGGQKFSSSAQYLQYQ